MRTQPLVSEGQGLPAQTINEYWARLQRDAERWLAPIWQRAAALGVQRWRAIAMALLLAWIISDVARLVWLVLPLQAQPAPLPTPINAAVEAPRNSAGSVDIETLVGWHLYGEVGAQTHRTVAEEEAQADTTLNLQLLGAIAASEPTQARAIILVDGKQQQFAIGEQLPGAGKVVLSKVLADRAIVDNNGRLETLWLYDPALNARQPRVNDPSEDSAAATVDMRTDAQVTTLAQNYRQQLYQNPSSLADVIQVAPAMESGKLLGYRISPGRDPAQFEKFGLKPGDIVTSVNNISLDDPQRAMELYNVIRSARDASISVRRGSEQLTMMISLDANTN
jgi:general secretion pathway protein C